MEDAVEITNDTFIRSTTDPEAAANLGSASWFKTFTQAASPYKTPLIITGAVIATMLAMAIPAKLMMGRSRDSGAVNVNNYNTANSSNENSNSNTMESPPRPSCPAPAQPTQAQYNMEAIQKNMKIEKP